MSSTAFAAAITVLSIGLVAAGYLVGREIERDRQRYRRERERSYRLARTASK